MPDREKYDVEERFKLRGDWREEGEKVFLSEDEAYAYGQYVSGVDTYATTSMQPTGYETRAQKPLAEVQKEQDVPEAQRPGGSEPQKPLQEEQEDAGAQEAETPTDLPDDYPGRSALVEDGRFVTASTVASASDEDLLAVSGIGKSTLDDIRSY